MRVFFLSEKAGGLTVNGAYLGMVDGFERSAELDPRDGLFCECAPFGYAPVCFRLDEDFLLDPPPQIQLYHTRQGVGVYICDFVRSDPTLSVLWQERVSRSRLTLCMQGRLTLNLENETGFHLISLPERLIDCRPSPCGEDILLEGSGAFVLLSREGEIRVSAEGRVLERNELLRAEVPFHDSAGHTAVMEWKEGALQTCSIRTAREPSEATFALALFESALIGADCEPYLAEDLKPKAGQLRSFLGEYTSVVLTEEPDLVGLVFERKPRVFDVRYFRVTLQDGKVSNIQEE